MKPPLKPKGGRLKRIMQRVWWLHSFGALAFGVGVMLFARKGLAHADKILIALALSWSCVFIAFRFIVGPANRSPDDKFVKKGVRLVTNYVIKQMYQQMFFFLVPLYASSAMWSLSSPNWWIVPLLLLCAVLSTMDLVFDNFIMEHRNIAAGMYGLCMFAVLNLMLPLVFHLPHFVSLMCAALITPPAVALLSYPLSSVVKGRGLVLTVLCSVGLGAGCFFGRVLVPPAPMAMAAGGIGHGSPGSYECVPGPLRVIQSDELDGLRCVTEITEPGGIHDKIVHVWSHDGDEILREMPRPMPNCDEAVVKSELPRDRMPTSVEGRWSCRVETGDGQLVGLLAFRVPKAAASKASATPPTESPKDSDAGPSDAAVSDANRSEEIDAQGLEGVIKTTEADAGSEI